VSLSKRLKFYIGLTTPFTSEASIVLWGILYNTYLIQCKGKRLTFYNITCCIFLSAFAKLRKTSFSLVVSVVRLSVIPSILLSEWNNWAYTERIFMDLNIWKFFENLLRKFKCHLNRTKIKGNLHEPHLKTLIARFTYISLLLFVYKLLCCKG